MQATLRLVGCSVILLAASVIFAAEHGDTMDAGIYLPDKIEWKDGPKSLPPGVQAAMLEGDPTKEGPFVMRLKMPDGYKVPAHTHPKMERVTIISGTLHIVMGETLDPRDAQKMPAGTFGYWDAGMQHFAWAEGETVLQLHGMGPWAINYLNPADDPRNK